MYELSRTEAFVSLTVEEEAERLRLERKVERAFYEAGLALKTLRDKKLYRSSHNNFRDYCQSRFGLKKSAVYYLIDAVDIVDNLKQCPPLVDILPTSERQCRPLKVLEPEQQRNVWNSAVEKAGGVPTAKMVETLVREFKPKRKPGKTAIKNQTIVREGCNLISGVGLDWYIRVDEETFKRLDGFAKVNGIPSLGLAVRRLLREV